MTKIARKTAFLTSLGAGLEYYDFIIYGIMASYLSSLFFAGDEPWISTVKVFAVFAIGYVVRPIGGVLFGMIGDTYGRKKTFLAVMLLMACSTFLIGLLPTYAQIGSSAPCLLIFLRILQGISFGAELPGAITVICESTDKQKQGFYTGYVISSVSLGSMLATFMLVVLSATLDNQQTISWGWRIPFLFGGLLAVANYFIRKYMDETPEFIQQQANVRQTSRQSVKAPIALLFKEYLQQVLVGIGLTLLISGLVIFYLYLPTYLSNYFSYQLEDIYFAMTVGLVWSAIILPACGWLSDCIGRSRTLLITCVGFCVGAFPLFEFLKQPGLFGLIPFVMIYQTILALATASYFPILGSLFPTAVRYTGIAACYNITYALMGCAPIIITALIGFTGTFLSGLYFLVFCAALSALAVKKLIKMEGLCLSK